MKEKKMTQKGITLIALIVTIIVLLILAGVSLRLIAGGDGIMNRASNAVDTYENAANDEKKELTYAEALIDEIDVNKNNIKYTDEKGDTAIIPKGFVPTGKDGEKNIEDGLVITDAEQNEFVWIPVKSEEEYVKKAGSKNYSMTAQNATDNGKTIAQMVADDVLGLNNIFGTSVTSTLADYPEKNVVVNAGGFWVGRYEAGTIDTGSDGSSNVTKINWGTAEIKSAKGIQPARYIKQTQALSRANTWLSNEYVQSGLITGTRMGCDV